MGLQFFSELVVCHGAQSATQNSTGSGHVPGTGPLRGLAIGTYRCARSGLQCMLEIGFLVPWWRARAIAGCTVASGGSFGIGFSRCRYECVDMVLQDRAPDTQPNMTGRSV